MKAHTYLTLLDRMIHFVVFFFKNNDVIYILAWPVKSDFDTPLLTEDVNVYNSYLSHILMKCRNTFCLLTF